MACKKAVLYGFDGIETVISALQGAGCFSVGAWVKHESKNATVDVNALLFSEEYTITYPIPLALYEKIFNKHFGEFSAHAGRLNVYTGQHLRYDQIQLMFRRVARACYDVLVKSKAELVVSSGIVHECVDTLLFALAHEMDIHTVSCTPFFYVSPPCFFITENGQSHYVISVPGENKDLDLSQFGFSPKALKGHASTLNKKIVKRILNAKNPHIVHNVYRHLSWVRKAKENVTDVSALSKDKRFVYFPLHYQPEASTCRMADAAFELQLVAIQEVSQKLPPNYLLLLKENPLQTFYYRTNDFYDAIHKLKNVRIVSNETPSHELLEKSDFAVTITGTVGWEALRAGKPVVFFGNPQYQHLSGAFRFTDTLNLQDVASHVVDQDVLQEEANSLYASAYSGDLTRSKPLTEDDIEVLINSLRKHIKNRFCSE
ncbi:capsular polysaccharide export protein, LipB/KpsS family [Halodesulfovibrio spirochaetisodalis]|uniref:Capsule polysaccharide biosynthesis protein n=1 Tax=Halodesulfovibrio spirochaetisodalis TaxID=1560234 RepID=A0A1B7XAI0_9BACT|nr:hypothetical protein [Halodesulfovibrio spirochaetisodalis]OBQ46399.1 hypothetical protein SP90_12790 [Halodesulfovibrio spirochaetisodalis]